MNAKIKFTEFNFCTYRGIIICDSYLKNVVFTSWTDEMVVLNNNVEENVKRLA